MPHLRRRDHHLPAAPFHRDAGPAGGAQSQCFRCCSRWPGDVRVTVGPHGRARGSLEMLLTPQGEVALGPPDKGRGPAVRSAAPRVLPGDPTHGRHQRPVITMASQGI